MIDNCPFIANPLQESVVFGQTMVADNPTNFGWPAPGPWFLSRGSFFGSVDLGNVDFTAAGRLAAMIIRGASTLGRTSTVPATHLAGPLRC